MIPRATRRCVNAYNSTKHLRQLSRPLSIALPSTASSSAESSDTARRASTAVPTIRNVRSASGVARSTSKGKTALVALKKGKRETVAQILSDAVAVDGGRALVAELARGVVMSRNGRESNINLFLDVLKSLPGANQADPSPFRGVLDGLEGSKSKDSLTILSAIGITCATKGFNDFVDTEILPRVSEKTSVLELAQWKADLAVASREFKGVVVDTDRVFEAGESIQEYEVVPPKPPSILELVEQTLPALLPEMDHHASSVFEPPTAEYFVNDSLTARAEDYHSSKALEDLVSKGNYEDAYALLQEMRALDVPIPSSNIYVEAAIQALSPLQTERGLTQYKALEKIALEWLALISSIATTGPLPGRLAQLIRTFELDPLTHLALIKKAGHILSDKGWFTTICFSSTRIIFLHCSPHDAMEWLKEAESKNERYWKLHRDVGAGLAEHTRFRIAVDRKYARGSAIRALVRNGHFSEAISLFTDPWKDHNNISIRVYMTTLDTLKERPQDPTTRSYIAQVQALLDDVIAFRQTLPNSAKANFLVPQPGVLPREPVAALRYLKMLCSKGMPMPTPPRYRDIYEGFMKDYLSAGRTRGLTLVLNRAFRHNPALAANLLAAEMLFYYQERSPVPVIKTFVRHFYLIGVPVRRILAVNDSMYHLPVGHYPPPQPLTPAARFHDPELLRFQIHKLIPTKEHVTLVWHALTSISQSLPELEHLYDKLKHVTVHKRDTDADFADAGIHLLDQPTALEPVVTASCFTSFICNLGHLGNSSLGAKVLHDMAELGLRPTLVQFTELARMYARSGFDDQAIAVMKELEQLAPLAPDAQPVPVPESTSTADTPGDVLNGPDVVFYKSLFVQYVARAKFAIARHVDQSMRKRFIVPDGEDDVFDSAYRTFTKHLQQREANGPVKVFSGSLALGNRLAGRRRAQRPTLDELNAVAKLIAAEGSRA